MKTLLVRNGVIAAAFVLGACAYHAAQESALQTVVENTASEATAAKRIEADIRYLADDAREGREAGTYGYQAAADYVAARLAKVGVEPGGKKGWFQYVPLRSATPVLDAAAMSVTSEDGSTQALTSLEDFRVYPSIDAKAFDISAPAVFVGYGVHAPDAGHDDLEGLDLEGKIAVYFIGAPDFFESEQRAHYQSRSGKMKEMAARGAIGAVEIQTTESAERTPWERYQSNPVSTSMTWIGPDGRADISGRGIKGRAVVRPEKAPLLFAGAPKAFEAVRAEADAKGGAPKGFDLSVTIAMSGAIDVEDIESPNVVGVIEGSDPVLKDEFLVLSAHLDHIGINQKLISEGKDGINNGAMDNALGIAVMLEVADRLLKGDPPKRSVIVLAVTAEEKGLLGADYFAHFPTVPKDAIAANVNLDMPVMLHPFTDVVAFGAERSSLGPIAKAALDAEDVALSPDPFPEQGIFTRSDHYRFVEQGVPAVYLIPGFANGGEEAFGGFLKEHYHKPSDDLSLPILYDDAARFAYLNYVIALNIANAEARPRWNEGDFFGELFSKKNTPAQ